MAVFVRITEECLQEAKKQDLFDRLKSFKSQIERKQSYHSSFHTFPSPYIVKKKFGNKQGRLIAQATTEVFNDEAHTLITFLALFLKKNRDYDQFQENAREFGLNYFKRRLVNLKKPQEYIEERLRKDPPIPKPELSDNESNYLWSQNEKAGYKFSCEDLIFESADWVKATEDEEVKHKLLRFGETIIEIVDKAIPVEISPIHNILSEPVKANPDYHILYCLFGQVLFLIDLVHEEGGGTNKCREGKKKWEDMLQVIDLDKIKQLSRRAYPSYLVADEDVWCELEGDPQSNFALSPEETDVLNAIYDDEKPFPLFINGRAGSGKSTILQYIFAEYVWRHLTYKSMKHNPVYYTLNKTLLDNAKGFIKTIIKKNHRFTEERNHREKVNKNFDKTVDDCFLNFRDYVKSLVPKQIRHKKYKPENYIDFKRFSELWHRKFDHNSALRKSVSPEISWHIIRTYIKGFFSEDNIDPQDYKSINKADKTVSSDRFEKVYTTIWENWYKGLAKKGYWDDQDIILDILQQGWVKSQFAGIFCDEAQDFTRIELEFLLRSSIFSERTIPDHIINRVPFVFAGDELQTLDPTGFKWNALKTGFIEKFVKQLNPAIHENNSQLNYKELSLNYRSSEFIVQFSNLIQLIRATQFDNTDIMPQETWNKAIENTPVIFVDQDDANFWDKIGASVIIIPSDNDDHEKSVRTNDILSKHIQIENHILSQTVLNTRMAKGLEFDQVVVFGFGDQFPSEYNLEKLLAHEKNEQKNDNIDLEYYFNKLYVAVSRAKGRLFIVDSIKGKDRLWQYAGSKFTFDLFFNKLSKTQQSKWKPEHIESFIEGSVDNILETNSETLWKNQATELRHRSLETKDPYIMRQAANAYRKCMDILSADKCVAKAYAFEKKYQEAAIEYKRLGYFTDAIECWWIEQHKESLTQLIKVVQEKKLDLKITVEYKFADFIISDSKEVLNAYELIKLLSSEIKKLNLKNTIEVFNAWRLAVNQILSSTETDFKNIDDKSNFLKSLIEINEFGIEVDSRYLALAAYFNDEFKKAIEFWDNNRGSQKKPDEYYIAQAHITGYPKKLTIIKQIKNWNWIIDEYQKHGDIELDSENAIGLILAYLHMQQIDSAIKVLPKINSKTHFETVLRETPKNIHKYDIVVNILEQCIDVTSYPMNWKKDLKKHLHKIKNSNNKEEALKLAAAIARMNNLEKDLPETANQSNKLSKRDISDFIKRKVTVSYSAIPDLLLFDVGAAIEKAGNRIEALKYYESIQYRFIKDSKEDVLCNLRWIKCKERQAEHNASTNLERSANQNKEAEERRKEINWPLREQIEDYPSPVSWANVIRFITDVNKLNNPPESTDIIKLDKPKIQTTTEEQKRVEYTRDTPPDKNEVNINGYRIAYFNANKRLNIECEKSGDTQRLLITENQMTGDWKFDEFTQSDYKQCFEIQGIPIRIGICDQFITLWFTNSGMGLKFSI